MVDNHSKGCKRNRSRLRDYSCTVFSELPADLKLTETQIQLILIIIHHRSIKSSITARYIFVFCTEIWGFSTVGKNICFLNVAFKYFKY